MTDRAKAAFRNPTSFTRHPKATTTPTLSLSSKLKGYKIWIDLPDTETHHSLCVSGLLVPSSLLRATDNVTA